MAPETWEETCKRYFAKCDSRGDFVKDVDGFLYYCPVSWHGYLPAAMLRALADELDRRNAPWQKIIDNDPAIGGG